MVKPSSSSSSKSSGGVDSCSSVYRGVRKRKWGKYVSEIRLPNSRERIWLGSYNTPEKAARAFDAALFCLRGKSAKFNFPNNPPEMEGCESLTPLQIQSVAAKFAHDHDHIIKTDILKYMSRSPSDISSSGYSYSSSSSTSTPSSTAATTDHGLVPIHDHDINKDLTMDWSFLDFLSAVPESVLNSTINYESADFGDFTAGMDDFSIDFFPSLPLPEATCADYVEDNGCTEITFPYHHHHNQQSFLWNF